MELLLGHLVGDFIFQTKSMAMNKSGNSWKCLIHCLIYTACVCCFTWCWKPLWVVAVFLSHFPIDRWSLADKWLHAINARSLKDFMENGQKNIPERDDQFFNYHVLRGGFTSIVYTVTDNTMHLVLMWFAWKFIMGVQ
jgi:hypothetical protein